MKKLGAICLFVIAGTTQAGDRLTTVDVYGLQVPGTPAIAKEAGFTDCKDNYSSYVCKRTKPTVVAGIKADSADLFLTVLITSLKATEVLAAAKSQSSHRKN